MVGKQNDEDVLFTITIVEEHHSLPLISFNGKLQEERAEEFNFIEAVD